jgi:hypothetical protein
MKKIIALLSLAVAVTTIAYSCRPAAKKEVIVVPSQQPVIIVKEPEKKSTTITLDKNGVKVEAKKVDVVLKKD